MVKRFIKAVLPHSITQAIIQRRMSPIQALEGPPSNIGRRRIPIVILTRAFNRLEYTTQCVDSVAQQITDISYIHVVIDQNSDDGTEQWFNWLWGHSKPYWANLGYISLKENLGDWGGLVLANAAISEKYGRIMQLDNDMQLNSKYTMEDLSYSLEVMGNNSVVMCRRLGAGDPNGTTGGDVPLFPLSRTYKLKLPFGQTKVYRVNHPVACFMTRRDLLDKAIEGGCTAACRICDSLGHQCSTYKLHDLTATHIQGWNGQKYLQHEKYYMGSVTTGMNYLKVSSEEILGNPKKYIDYTLPPASDKEWLKI
jgi:hypothetical protein